MLKNTQLFLMNLFRTRKEKLEPEEKGLLLLSPWLDPELPGSQGKERNQMLHAAVMLRKERGGGFSWQVEGPWRPVAASPEGRDHSPHPAGAPWRGLQSHLGDLTAGPALGQTPQEGVAEGCRAGSSGAQGVGSGLGMRRVVGGAGPLGWVQPCWLSYLTDICRLPQPHLGPGSC